MSERVESWVEKIRREHPYAMAWEDFKFQAWTYYAWVFDRPCWDFSEDQPRLVKYRTRRPVEIIEPDAGGEE